VLNDDVLFIDDHLVVACTPGDVLRCLAGPPATAGWFGGHRDGFRTTITSPVGDLVLQRAHEEWRPDDGAYSVVGTTGDLWFRAHLTVRAVIRSDADQRLLQGSELWGHVELGPAGQATHAGVVIRQVLRRGLEHLRLELDVS
jgi:hypothetical protein